MQSPPQFGSFWKTWKSSWLIPERVLPEPVSPVNRQIELVNSPCRWTCNGTCRRLFWAVKFAPVAQMDQSGRFLNLCKHFFWIFDLMGFRIFSLILLTDFQFRRQFQKSDLWLFLVLICSKNQYGIKCDIRFQTRNSVENLTGKSGAPAPNWTGISSLGNSLAFCMTVSRKRLQSLVIHKVVMIPLHTIWYRHVILFQWTLKKPNPHVSGQKPRLPIWFATNLRAFILHAPKCMASS